MVYDSGFKIEGWGVRVWGLGNLGKGLGVTG